MPVFDTVVDELVEKLNLVPSLSDIRFKNSYNNPKKPNPLVYTSMSMGFGGMKIKNCAFGDFAAAKPAGEMYIKACELIVEFELCTAQNTGASKGIEALDKICEALLFDKTISDKAVYMEADKQIYDKSLSAFVIKGTLKFKFALSQEYDESAIRNIVVKGVY